jgi:hypothetical protein
LNWFILIKKTGVYLVFFLFLSYGKEVYAHDLDQHDSNSLAELIPDILLITLIVLIGFIWFKIYISFYKDKKFEWYYQIHNSCFFFYIMVISNRN